MATMTLYDEVSDLIELGTEGDYWDFKLKWYENNADLLHDIICMANNLVNRDAYIIIGVSDSISPDGVQIKGVPATDRKSQQNLINTVNTPYYLTEPFMFGKECVQSGHVYVRIGDTNTPKKACADIDKVEYLWRKRFGIDLPVMEKLLLLW